jgi:hypothetical protein
MKRISVGLLVIIFMVSGCSRQVPPQTELEATAATWTQVGGKVDPGISGIYSRISSLAFTLDASPIVAVGKPTINSTGYSFSTVYVKRWVAGQWQTLGGHLDIQKSRPAGWADIAVDRLGRPVVAWMESTRASTNAAYDVYVKRWDGQAWVLLGGKLEVNPATNYSTQYPSLAVDSQNRPVVAFSDSGNIYVKRWENESSWVQVGDALDIDVSKSVFFSSIAVDPSDRIVVAWSEPAEPPSGSVVTGSNVYVKRWNGSRWVSLGTALDVDPINYASHPSLALSSGGRIFIAWEERKDIGSFSVRREVYVKRWDGTAWTLLGGALNTELEDGVGPSLATNGSDKVIVSWQTGLSYGSVHVDRWNGSDWVPVGNQPVATESGETRLGISPSGVSFLAYYDLGDVSNYYDNGAFVKSYQ